MKRLNYNFTAFIAFIFVIFVLGFTSKAQNTIVLKTWDFEDSSFGNWVSGNQTASIELTTEKAYSGSQSVKMIQTDNSVETNFQNDIDKVQQGDSISFKIWISSADLSIISGIQIFWQTGSDWTWHNKWFSWNMLTGDSWNQLGVTFPVMESPLQRIGIQLKSYNTTDMPTIYIDDITVSKTDTTLVSQWGMTSLGTAWPLIPNSNAGSVGIGDGNKPTDWSTVSGHFSTLTATTTQAIVVTGQMQFLGGGGDVEHAYTWLRYALTFQDSAVLNDAGTASAMWVSSKKWYGYEFDPISGSADNMANGTLGKGTVWAINDGNWNSTNSNGGPPLSQLMNQPLNAEAPAGIYNFAVSVQSINDTLNEIRWYLVEQNNNYWFGGKIQAVSTSKKFNAINFAFNDDFQGTQVNFSNVKAELGAPITTNMLVPIVPIATARGMENDTVKVAGVVISPNYQTTGRSYYIWDGTGGLATYINDLTSPALKLGDSVIVVGNIAPYKGLLEIYPLSDNSIVVIDSNATVPKPEILTVNQFNTNAENYESHLIEFSNLIKISGTWPTSKSNSTLYLTDDNGKDTLTVFLDSDIGLYNSPEPTWPADVIGVGSQYSSSGIGGYQFLPRYISDFMTSGALPTELESFTADVMQISVVLHWETATEVNNYGFEIERSVDNSNWTKIGFAKGHGNSNSTKHYTFTDDNTGNGSKFKYRLKQIDNDGKYEYSKEVEVDIAPKEYTLYQNYPNPFNPTTTVRYSLPKDSHVKITIYNSLGQEVEVLVDRVQPAGFYNQMYNAQNLASGVYFYSIYAEALDGSKDYRSIKKMILLK